MITKHDKKKYMYIHVDSLPMILVEKFGTFKGHGFQKKP